MKALAFFLSVLSVSSTIADLNKAEVSAFWNLGRSVVYVCNPVQLGKLGHELPVTFMNVASTGKPLEIDKYWPDNGDTVVVAGPSEQNKSGVTKIAEFSRNRGMHSGTTYTFTEIVDSPAGPIHLVQEVTGTAAKSSSRVGVAVPSANVRELYDDTKWHQIEVSSNNGQGKVVVSYCSYHSRSLPTTVSVLDPYAAHQGTSIAHRITQGLWKASSALLGVGFADVLAGDVIEGYREKIGSIEEEKRDLQKEVETIYNKSNIEVVLQGESKLGTILKYDEYGTKDQWDQKMKEMRAKGYEITGYRNVGDYDQNKLQANIEKLEKLEEKERNYLQEMKGKGLNVEGITQQISAQAESRRKEDEEHFQQRKEQMKDKDKIEREALHKRVEEQKAREKTATEQKAREKTAAEQKNIQRQQQALEQGEQERKDARFKQNVTIAAGAAVVVVLTTAMVLALTVAPTPFSNMVYVIECK